jgi:Lecithin:cholesterol acyltransferase
LSKNFFFMLILLLILTTAVSVAGTHERMSVKRPLILVPGYVGSPLYVGGQLAFPSANRTQWLASLTCEHGNKNKNSNSNFEKCSKKARRLNVDCNDVPACLCDGGRCTVSTVDEGDYELSLDAIGTMAGYYRYFGDMIDFLVNVGGYERGVTLFGLAYDWRVSHARSGAKLARLARLVDPERRGVDVLSHSMGFFVVQNAMSMFAERPALRTYIAVGAPCNGIPPAGLYGAMLASSVGERGLTLSEPIGYELGARGQRYPRGYVQFRRAGDTVTMRDSAPLAALVTAAIESEGVFAVRAGAKQYADAKERVLERVQAERGFVIYGALTDTPESAAFDVDVDEQHSGNADFGRLIGAPVSFPDPATGDGTVTADSAMCTDWIRNVQERAGLPLYGHTPLVQRERPLRLVERYLDVSCTWAGQWRVRIEASPAPIFETITFEQATSDTVAEASYALRGRLTAGNTLNGTLVGTFGHARFGFEIDDACVRWRGYWQYAWSDKYAWSAERLSSPDVEPPPPNVNHNYDGDDDDDDDGGSDAIAHMSAVIGIVATICGLALIALVFLAVMRCRARHFDRVDVVLSNRNDDDDDIALTREQFDDDEEEEKEEKEEYL